MMALVPVMVFGAFIFLLGLYFLRQGEAEKRQRDKKWKAFFDQGQRTP